MSNDALNLLLALLPETILLGGGALLVILLPREKGLDSTGPGARVPAILAFTAVVAAIHF